jgi:hypothetical protein
MSVYVLASIAVYRSPLVTLIVDGLRRIQRVEIPSQNEIT